MQKSDIRALILSSHHDTINVVQGRRHDAAIKLYFYPAAMVLLTADEFTEWFLGDEITVRRSSRQSVIATIPQRLCDLVQDMPIDELHLTAFIYGLVNGHKSYSDFIIQVDKLGKSIQVTYKVV